MAIKLGRVAKMQQKCIFCQIYPLKLLNCIKKHILLSVFN